MEDLRCSSSSIRKRKQNIFIAVRIRKQLINARVTVTNNVVSKRSFKSVICKFNVTIYFLNKK